MKASFRPSSRWLAVCIPLTLLLEVGQAPPPVIFFAAALAIVPIAGLIVRSTEQIATRTGDAVGGLLNATFGNAPELIIAIVALRAGLFDLVRASLIGAILANLLLALGGWRSLLDTWRSLRFLELFVFMVLALLLVPLLLRYHALWVVLATLYLNAFLVSLAAGGYGLRLRRVFFAGWVLVVLLKAASAVAPEAGTPLYVASRIVVVALLGGSVVATLQYVLSGAEVSTDRVFAGIVAYMLVALGFAAGYQAIAAVAPGSFALPAEISVVNRPDLEVQLTYFSFVTIATLGYGDIGPRLPFAQMLAVLEAVFGQFYVAVVIAWLVSMYAGRQMRRGA